MRNLILLSIFTLSTLFNGLVVAKNFEFLPIATAYVIKTSNTEIENIGLGMYTFIGVGLSSNSFMGMIY